MIDDLMNGRGEVVIRSNGFSIYDEHAVLSGQRTPSGVTVELVLKRLDGVIIGVPNIFEVMMGKDEYEKFARKLLITLRAGFAITDETVHKDKPVMGSTQL